MKQFIPIVSLVFLWALAPLAHADDTTQAIAACKQALQEDRGADAIKAARTALNRTPKQRELLICLGRAQSALDQHDDAIATFRLAEDQSTTPAEHVIALTLMANQYSQQKSYDYALAAYQASLNHAQNAKLPHYEMVNLIQIGETLEAMGDEPGALNNYLKAHKLAANDNERADASAHVAAASSALGQHSQAIEYQIKALMMEERSGEFDHYALAGVEMGRIYLAAKEYANAEKALNKTLTLATASGSAFWEAKALTLLAQVFSARQEFSQARASLQLARSKALAAGAEQLVKDIDRLTETLPK